MKKLVFVLCVLLIASFFASKQSFAQAQETAYSLNTNPDVPQNQRSYVQGMFIQLLSTATCFVGGTDLINPSEKCLGFDPQTKKIGYIENGGGLTQVAGGLIGATYNIPISGSHYVRYLAGNFGLTSSSYAALTDDNTGGSSSGLNTGFGTGIGFIGLTPVLDIWQAFRNLTYLLFVIVFIVIGIGIMFRLNIDARTVMTIQNQIPKIIIALVLITLSYAIAGFLIDMMYVTIYLVIHIFDSQGLITLTNISTNPVMAVGHFGGINDIASPVAKGVQGIVSSLFEGTTGNLVGALVGFLIGGFIGGGGGITGLIGGAIGGIVGLLGGNKILGIIAMVIAYLIISIAILSTLFRVWFMLIKAYIFILLDVIFAPFWILGGVLPGAPGGVGPWLRSMLANLAAFPTVIVLFMIGRTIQELSSNRGGNFVPPLIGDPGANSGEAIGSIIGLGIILIMPEAVNMTKQAFKAPENKYVSSIGRALSVGQGVVSKPIGGVKDELFGKDALGAPKMGSTWAGKRFGKIGQVLTGGGLHQKDGENTPWVKFPSRPNKILGFKTKKGKAEAAERQKQDDLNKSTTEIKNSGGFNPHLHEEVKMGDTTYYRRKKIGDDDSDSPSPSGQSRDPNNPPASPGGVAKPLPHAEHDAGASQPNQEEISEVSEDEGGNFKVGDESFSMEELARAVREEAFKGAVEGSRRESIFRKIRDIALGANATEEDLKNREKMKNYLGRAHAQTKQSPENGGQNPTT